SKFLSIFFIFFILFFAFFLPFSYAQDAPDERPEASALENCLKDFVNTETSKEVEPLNKEILKLKLKLAVLDVERSRVFQYETGLRAKLKILFIKDEMRRTRVALAKLEKKVNKIYATRWKSCGKASDSCADEPKEGKLAKKKKCVAYNKEECKVHEAERIECLRRTGPECTNELRDFSFENCKDDAEQIGDTLKSEMSRCAKGELITELGKTREGFSVVKISPDPKEQVCEQGCVITRAEARHVCREMFPPAELNDEDSICSNIQEKFGDAAGYVEEMLDHGIKCAEDINKKTGQNNQKRFSIGLKSKLNPNDAVLNQQIPDPNQDPADQPTMFEAVFRF
ncbi:MAG: hypothetical protein AABX65_02240, partial [Nanoarchaeota archaeon]